MADRGSKITGTVEQILHGTEPEGHFVHRRAPALHPSGTDQDPAQQAVDPLHGSTSTGAPKDSAIARSAAGDKQMDKGQQNQGNGLFMQAHMYILLALASVASVLDMLTKPVRTVAARLLGLGQPTDSTHKKAD